MVLLPVLNFYELTEVTMSRICAICGKKSRAGRTIKRRGMAKKKGGAGKKITGITKRVFAPNLQKVRISIKGKVQRVYTCIKCLKAGKATKV